ncbi:hypothetical protein [Legionella sp. WA2024007413]
MLEHTKKNPISEEPTLSSTNPSYPSQTSPELAVTQGQTGEKDLRKTSDEAPPLNSKPTLDSSLSENKVPLPTVKKELKFTKSLKVNDMRLFLKDEMPLGALYTDPEKKPSGPKVLKINTTWEKNTKQIQLLANKQRRIQHDKLLKKLLILIETLLEQPMVFRYLDHLEKFSVKPPNNLTRFINFLIF